MILYLEGPLSTVTVEKRIPYITLYKTCAPWNSFFLDIALGHFSSEMNSVLRMPTPEIELKPFPYCHQVTLKPRNKKIDLPQSDCLV